MKDCGVEELKQRMEMHDAPILIDVREADEVAICAIPGSIHVPMGDIPSRLSELDRHAEEEVVVYCHHGMRSASVKAFLRNHGFEKVRNLTGGINAWAIKVDPSMPRY